MENWPVQCRGVFLCFFFTFLTSVFGEVMYIYAKRNSSIEFSCISPPGSGHLFAFSLHREWIDKGEVLYHNIKDKPQIKYHTLMSRISTQVDINEENFQTVNVTISHLLGSDTDVYVCMFHYDIPKGFQNFSGKYKFVLYVEDHLTEECMEDRIYTPLLFALSAATGLLFIIVILATVYCMKSRHKDQIKPQFSVPIYEEMNGVREKRNSHMQGGDSSLYTWPKKENPYIN